MAHRLLLVLRRQPVAFLALFVALSGSSYAAVSAGKAGQGDVIVGCVGDKDGKLTKTEAAALDSLTQVFDKADADKDGALTPDEYKAYLAVNGKARSHGG